MDSFGRKIDYLRISVTDRCNERCSYCMPEGYRGWEQTPDHLTAEEIVRVVRVAASLGFRKFRLTGGEPLVRRDLIAIVEAISAIAGVEAIGLSTNGTQLAPVAFALRAAGLRTINISLDALDPLVYRRITGGDVEAVLAGIHAATTSGFESVKLNCVLMRGVNEHELWPLAQFAAEHALPLRLIELMPLTRADVLDRTHFLSVDDAMRRLQRHDELVPQLDSQVGWGPAKYYVLRHCGAKVGFIGALTTPHFCASCNKMRLTADGRIRHCLGKSSELDLRAILRTSASDDGVREAFMAALRHKPFSHSLGAAFKPERPMTAIGG